MVIGKGVDTAFVHAIERARANPADRTKPGNPADLLAWLQSDAPLGEGERDRLADLLSELAERVPRRSKKGRPPGTAKLSATALWHIVAEYDASIVAGRVRKQSLHDVADKYGISKRTLEAAISDVRSAEGRMKEQGLPNWRLRDWLPPKTP